MRSILTLTLAVTATLTSFAQTGPLVKDPPPVEAHDSLLPNAHIGVRPFNTVIDAVLRDLPFSLVHITGELVLAQGEFENYASTLELPDAESCIVTRYHSTEDTTVSWQAKMGTRDDYSSAARLYKELYRKLSQSYVKLVDGSIIYLQGEYEPARENASFTTSTLHVQTGDPAYREVKIELELVYQLADWAVNVNIHTKKRDDEVGQ